VRQSSRLPALLASTAAALAFCGSAQAAPVTVGSPLVGPFKAEGPTSIEATLLNLTFGEAGAHATSPVSGAIVRWHVLDALGGPFKLRVLRPVGGPVYTAVNSSAPVTAATTGFETFPTDLPVQAGDTVGVDIPLGVKFGLNLSGPASSAAYWVPPLSEGATEAVDLSQSGGEFGFNAEVQPTPTVGSISPSSGSAAGGSAVTISGTDFTSVSGVKFGANAAASYSVGSEGLITAVAPPGAPSTTDITVTTVAGTSPVTAADKFSYNAEPTPSKCIVPKLKGMSLKTDRKKLAKAGCRVGKVTGKKSKRAKVKKQSIKAGKVLAAGSKVNVGLAG
jgi:hypothetical protein